MVSIWPLQLTIVKPKGYHEKKTHEILEKIRELILNENFKNSFKSSVQDFTRDTLVSFPILILFILNLARRSLQSELTSFTKLISLPLISKQTFSAARKKLSSDAFVELNNKLVDEFYNANEFQKYQGYRLIVADGSTLQLPESPTIREKYGACSNQVKSNSMSMARISSAYDPLTGITLHAVMKPYKASEREMVCEHILNIRPSNDMKDLYLLDRGYPSILLIFFLHYYGKDFVIRCNASWLSLVQNVLKNGKKDEVIEINPKMLTGKQRKEFKNVLSNVCLKHRIKIRVLIIDLPTGEKEILITSLIDKNEFKYETFTELYHLRWGGEENYKFHKVRIEIENFSGKTPHAIEQDFHATIFTGNVRALIAEEAQAELEQIYPKKEFKYVYKINKNISAAILKDEIVNALWDAKIDLQVFCEKLKKKMKKSTIPIRPGRQFSHVSKRGSRKYPMNMRRAL